MPDGSWLGVDGDFWYRVWPEGDQAAQSVDALAYVAERRKPLGEGFDRFLVKSNGTLSDFSSLFRLDWDADAVEREVMALGPELEPYLGSLCGLRLMRPSSATETFFCFLCTPNNNIARITQMVRRLAAYGPLIATVEGVTLHRFPGVEAIAAIPEDDLRKVSFGYRARTIPHVARQVMERGGQGWIDALYDRPYEEVHRDLCSIVGIGPKLADCIALFAFHKTEAVPLDTHLMQAATRLYFPELKGKALTDQRYRQISSFIRGRFGKLTGWAHQYLFYDNVLNWRTRRPV